MTFLKKTNYKVVLLLVSIFTFSNMLMTSCKKETVNSIPVYEQKEQVGKKIKELSDLLAASTFGVKKDMYPVESRGALESTIVQLKQFLEDIKVQKIAPQNVASETVTLLNTVEQKQAQFLASRLKESLIIKGLLHVNGKDGGYIDFGSHPEFSNFDGGPFTVELWVKFVEYGNFDVVLSTFLDNFQGGNDKVFQGWGVNWVGDHMRMSYALGIRDLYEPTTPDFKRDFGSEWVHLAYVWNPQRVDDGSGNPRTFKMYVNGVLRKDEDWGNSYAPNTVNQHMYGFTQGNFYGGALTDRGTNGFMKNMNVWKSIKTQAQILKIKDTPESVIGTEPDLVCGWRLTTIAEDNNAIPDITGKYSAKIYGNFNWIETP